MPTLTAAIAVSSALVGAGSRWTNPVAWTTADARLRYDQDYVEAYATHVRRVRCAGDSVCLRDATASQ